MATPQTQSDSSTSKVIFRPLIENVEQPMTKKFWGRFALTDHGDHVEWTNGKRSWRWRLPDQPTGSTEYPLLTAILFVRTTNAFGVGNGADRITFIDDAGNTLAHLSPQHLVPVDMEKIILPDEAYDQLKSRGVKLVREEFRSDKQYFAAHPDDSLSPFSLSFASHPGLWMGGLILAIIIVVNLILLLTGYYS